MVSYLLVALAIFLAFPWGSVDELHNDPGRATHGEMWAQGQGCTVTVRRQGQCLSVHPPVQPGQHAASARLGRRRKVTHSHPGLAFTDVRTDKCWRNVTLGTFSELRKQQ